MDTSDLVALVFRTDWTQLSLSATVSHTFDPLVAGRVMDRKAGELGRVLGPLQGAWRPPTVDYGEGRPVRYERSLLTAPGGRYRVQGSNGYLIICDGEDRWDVSDGTAHRSPRHGAGRDFHGLLTPQWLIACYELQIAESVLAGGRAAIRVTGTPRTASTRHHDVYHLLDRVEVLVDSELGILLSSRQIFEDQTRESAELRDLVINPPEAGIPGSFALPPDTARADDDQPFGSFQPPAGIGWQVAGATAGVAAHALGFAIRRAARRTTVWPTDDEEPAMPGDALLTTEDWENGQPPDDPTVNLLHRTALSAPELTADVHEWIDARPLVQNARMFHDKMPAPLKGIFGPAAVWDALSERAAEDEGGHRVARLAVQLHGHYRLDYVSGDWGKRYKAIACDGGHTTKLFDDRVATGPVTPLDAGLAAMLDPAWLLSGWRLATIGPAAVDGRNGIKIRAIATSTADDGAGNQFARADLVVDAELGVLLRNTTYVNDQPATRTELRNLRPLAEDTSFRIAPGPGMRSVTDSGGPFGDRNLPRPAEAAATAATLAAAGAVAVTGWLEKHRARREPPG